MNFKFPTPISTLCFIAFLLSFSCSKDNDLLADYVLADAQGADKLITLIVDDKYITTPNTSVILDVLANDTYDEDSEVKILNTSEPLNGTVEIIDNKTILYTPGQIDVESTVIEGEIEDNTSAAVEGTDAATEEEVEPITEEVTTSSEEATDTFSYTVEVIDEDETVSTEVGNVTVDVTEYGELKAFPSAYGAGAYTKGGRGGIVIHVTNLNASGAGSFRAALETQGKRTIVFDVSGTINLGGSIIYLDGSSHSNLTIAGQTAPEGGITITNGRLDFWNLKNAIIRHIRVRPRMLSGGLPIEADALTFWGGSDIILDHLSLSYAGDEALDIGGYPNTNSVANNTIQRTLIGSSKTGLLLGGHSGGNSGNNSFIYNLGVDLPHRFPNVGGSSRFDILNNVMFNWKNRIVNIYTGSSQLNYIGNYNKEGVANAAGSGDGYPGTYNVIQASNGSAPSIYSAGNFRSSNGTTADKWYRFSSPWDDLTSTHTRGTQFNFLPNTPWPMSASEAYGNVLADVGANKYFDESGAVQVYLDSYDSGKIANVQSGTSGYLYDANNFSASDWPLPTLPANTRQSGYDTDKDGMADAWEVANGLNPNDSSDGNQDRNDDGYTNLEDFLNQVDF